MISDVYSHPINVVCEFYNISKVECVEYYWDEVEEYMSMLTYLKNGIDDETRS